MVGRFGLEGMRGVESQSGERRRGGTSVTGRGSCSAGQSKGEPAVLGRLVASARTEVGDEGGGVVSLVGQAGWEASWPEREWATR
jgi:hypothetical protein